MISKTILATAALVALLPVAASAGEVQNRINALNGRIDHGVTNGSLTAGEYNRLDRSADRIAWERNRDLRRNGGTLTPAEARSLNRQENRLSDRVYFDKHNLRRQ